MENENSREENQNNNVKTVNHSSNLPNKDDGDKSKKIKKIIKKGEQTTSKSKISHTSKQSVESKNNLKNTPKKLDKTDVKNIIINKKSRKNESLKKSDTMIGLEDKNLITETTSLKENLATINVKKKESRQLRESDYQFDIKIISSESVKNEIKASAESKKAKMTKEKIASNMKIKPLTLDKKSAKDNMRISFNVPDFATMRQDNGKKKENDQEDKKDSLTETIQIEDVDEEVDMNDQDEEEETSDDENADGISTLGMDNEEEEETEKEEDEEDDDDKEKGQLKKNKKINAVPLSAGAKLFKKGSSTLLKKILPSAPSPVLKLKEKEKDQITLSSTGMGGHIKKGVDHKGEPLANKKKVVIKKTGKKAKFKDNQSLFSDNGIEDLTPINLSQVTQELLDLRIDDDITREEPIKFIRKDVLIADIQDRSTESEFYAIKKIIFDYEDDAFIIVYDYDNVHGQNFYIATSKEAKENIMREIAEKEAKENEDDNDMIDYGPPQARLWTDLGSAKQIDETIFVSQKGSKLCFRNFRKNFGHEYHFSDSKADDNKSCVIEIMPYQDKTFDIPKIELDIGIQVVPEVKDMAIQTIWKNPTNASVQCQPREISADLSNQIMASTGMAEFLKNAIPKFDKALQQNAILDLFSDDWDKLWHDVKEFGNKGDNHLKEYQSFTDMRFSKAHSISCIDWHPKHKNIVAVSILDYQSFNERVETSHKKLFNPSMILIWGFSDPIHPQLYLDAPDQILCFKFNPSNPNFIAAGLMNGQIIMWDITQYADVLVDEKKNKNTNDNFGFLSNGVGKSTQFIRHSCLSNLEHGHQYPITDIQWLPAHLEINKSGLPIQNVGSHNHQLVTCSADQTVLFWDIRPMKGHLVIDTRQDIINNVLVSQTFKYLDSVWKPLLKVNLLREESVADHAPTKFSLPHMIPSLQNISISQQTLITHKYSESSVIQSSKSISKSQLENKEVGEITPVENPPKITSKFFVGTEEGEVVYLDWVPVKDQDTGKIQTKKPLFVRQVHASEVLSLERSPFFNQLILSVGGWSFAIWVEEVEYGPILQSCLFNKRLTFGAWSPSRSSVFFISKIDGSIDIWDLIDRTHEPCIMQNISSVALTYISPQKLHKNLEVVALGDQNGTLHVLKLPDNYCQSSIMDLKNMASYITKEINRLEYMSKRWEEREKEKIQLDIDTKKRTMTNVVNITLTEEELEAKLLQEYQEFLEEEARVLKKLNEEEEETNWISLAG